MASVMRASLRVLVVPFMVTSSRVITASLTWASMQVLVVPLAQDLWVFTAPLTWGSSRAFVDSLEQVSSWSLTVPLVGAHGPTRKSVIKGCRSPTRSSLIVGACSPTHVSIIAGVRIPLMSLVVGAFSPTCASVALNIAGVHTHTHMHLFLPKHHCLFPPSSLLWAANPERLGNSTLEGSSPMQGWVPLAGSSLTALSLSLLNYPGDHLI